MPNVARRHEDQVREAPHDNVDERLEHSVSVTTGLERRRQRGRQASVRLLGVQVRLAVERGGEDGGARVVERRDGALEAHAAEALHALRLEARQHVRLGGLEAAGAAERDVDDLEHFVFVDGRDALAQQHRFDLRVLVQVADFRDGAEADGGGG